MHGTNSLPYCPYKNLVLTQNSPHIKAVWAFKIHLVKARNCTRQLAVCCLAIDYYFSITAFANYKNWLKGKKKH